MRARQIMPLAREELAVVAQEEKMQMEQVERPIPVAVVVELVIIILVVMAARVLSLFGILLLMFTLAANSFCNSIFQYLNLSPD